MPGEMANPILHLSLPVRELAESIEFYVDVMGCEVGRVRDSYADVWFFGMQVTLHEVPDQVEPPREHGVRHYGVTLDADGMDAILKRIAGRRVTVVSKLATDHAGTPLEQTKIKVLDPSGNVIELKTYPDPEAALHG